MALRGTTIANSSQIVGTNTNNDAAAGGLGEYVVSTVGSGSAVSLTTDTPANVTSISLTAGDWDVTGVVEYTGNAATTVSKLISSLSTTSATVTTAGTNSYDIYSTHAAITIFINGNNDRHMGPARVSIAATTTVYLVARGTFAVNSCSAFGQISARRAR